MLQPSCYSLNNGESKKLLVLFHIVKPEISSSADSETNSCWTLRFWANLTRSLFSLRRRLDLWWVRQMWTVKSYWWFYSWLFNDWVRERRGKKWRWRRRRKKRNSDWWSLPVILIQGKARQDNCCVFETSLN